MPPSGTGRSPNAYLSRNEHDLAGWGATPLVSGGIPLAAWSRKRAGIRSDRGYRSRTISSWDRPSCLSAVLLPVAQGPDTIIPRRALISLRFSKVSSRPCRVMSRSVDVATTTSSEW